MSRIPTRLDEEEEEKIREQLCYVEGDRVKVSGTDRCGRARFIGQVHFAAGVWCGIEIPTPDGKNAGMVDNVRYFTCKPKHGLFIRAMSCEKDEELHIDAAHTHHLSNGTPIKPTRGSSSNGPTPAKRSGSSTPTPTKGGSSSSSSSSNSSSSVGGKKQGFGSTMTAPAPSTAAVSISTPSSGGGRGSLFVSVFGSGGGNNRSVDSGGGGDTASSIGSPVGSGGGNAAGATVEQMVKTEAFKKAVGSIVAKQSQELLDLKRRVQSLEADNRELKATVRAQEKFQPSLLKSLERQEEAFQLISRLSVGALEGRE